MFRRLMVVTVASCSLVSALPAQDGQIRLASRDGWLQTPDSVRLYYRVVGSGVDTVVVVHGGPGFHMNYLVPDLTPMAAHRTLIFYDQRNAGRSTLLSDTARVNARHLVDDLDAVRKHFRMQRLTLLGHSWGGLLAGLYASRHPERVSRMILVGASAPPGAAVPSFNPMARLDSATDAIRVRNLRAFRGGGGDTTKSCWDYYALWSRPWFVKPVHARRMWGDNCNVPPFAMLNPTRSYPVQSLARQDVTAAVAGIRAPTLVLHGESDPVPMAWAEAWVGLLPAATLFRIPEAGHLPWIEKPQTFFAVVDRFLDGLSPDSTVLSAGGTALVKPGDARRTPYLSSRAAIADVENQLVAAMNRADFDSVSRIYSEQAVIFAAGGPPITGRQAIASFWRTAAKRGMRTVELTLMDLEGSSSFLNAIGKYAIRDAQGEILDVGKFLASYRREHGRWRLIRDVFNSSMETRSPLEEPDYLTPPL